MTKLRFNMDDIPDFVAVDPGKHRAKLEEVEEGVSKKGKDKLVFKWIILEGDNEGRSIQSHVSLDDNALGSLKTHMAAFGYSGDVNIDTKVLHGRTAIIVVRASKYRDADTGEEKEGAQIMNVLPDPKSSKSAASSASGSKKTGKVSTGGEDNIPF